MSTRVNARRAFKNATESLAPEVMADPAIRAQKFFAKANILSNLMKSRLAIPLTYPMSSGGMALKLANDKGKFEWDPQDAARSMSQITPAVIGLAKMSKLFKASHALSYYQGGAQRTVGAIPIVPELYKDVRTNSLHPEVWRMQKPGDEWNTRHVGWRKK